MQSARENRPVEWKKFAVGVLVISIFIAGCLWTLSHNPKKGPTEIDLGNLPDDLETHLLVTRTFDDALMRYPNEDLVKVSFHPAGDLLFLQYYRSTGRIYFGDGTAMSHDWNHKIDPTKLGCGYTEIEVHKILRSIIRGDAKFMVGALAEYPLEYFPNGKGLCS